MERNVVIFGPAEAGKSTLTGCMIAKLNPHVDLKKEISKIKKKLGNQYQEDCKLAYISDKAMDERKRQHYEKGGTTIYMQMGRIWINDHEAMIIDTPGHESWYRERTKGMYYGEIGIFMIELSKLKEDLLKPENYSTLKTFFTPLILWNKFRDKKRRPIIVISKIDEFDFSEEKFNEATEIIRIICGERNIKTIPISINWKKCYDHNVFRKSEKMNWYDGPTLFDELDGIIKKSPEIEIDEPLFSHVDKQFNVSGIGRAWRAKILQGTLEKGSSIKIAPVKCENDIYFSCLARVRNIREEQGEDIEIVKKGSIVGLDIHNIKIKGKRCERGKFYTVNTSCIVDPSTPLLVGNILQFKVPLEETEKLNLLESVMILWFGRFVSSRIVHFGDDGLITLEMDNSKVCLPLDDNSKFSFNKFILKMQDKFIQATKEKLGVPHTLTLSLKNIDDKKDYIRKYFTDFEYEILEDKIRFYCKGSLIDLVSKIKKIDIRLIEESEDVFHNVSIKIEELKEI